MSPTLVTSSRAVEQKDRNDAPIPPLRTGDHLSRAEFHRRYEAMGEGVRAELIEGVVYIWGSASMASPVSIDRHGAPHLHVVTWVGVYCSKTPGLVAGDNSTVFIDGINEPQPDVLLGIPPAAGGQTKLVTRDNKQYVDGAPELLIEVAASTTAIDLNAKLRAYERNSAGEYLVIITEERPEVRWLSLVDGSFRPIALDTDGLLRSGLFPGLWLDPAALLSGNLAKLLATLERGCATDEHRGFVQRLASATP